MSQLQNGGYAGSAIDLSNAQSFISELWTGEVRKFRDAKFYLKQAATVIPFEGRKGDVIHIPGISRMAVYDKLPQTPVNLQARTESDFTFTITKYKESSFMVEDIVNIQSQYALRTHYTREAGYALTRDLDNFLLAHRAVANSFPTQRIYSYGAGLLGDGTLDAHLNGTPHGMTLGAVLLAKRRMDEADVPQEGRLLIVSPAQYAQLLTINQFISRDFQNGTPVEDGVVGSIFNMTVMMTSQIGFNSNTGYRNGQDGVLQPTPGVLNSPYLPDQHGTVNGDTVGSASDISISGGWRGLPVASGAGATAADGGQTLGTNSGTSWHTALAVHSSWLGYGIQQAPKVESSREAMFLADAVISSHLYGAKVMRNDGAVVIHTSGT